jgi:hypothetical protein
MENCDPNDDTVFWIEVKGDGKTIESAHLQVGEFIMESLQQWQQYKVETGTEPHIHVMPRMLSRIKINKLEVERLVHDPRTYINEPDA